MVPNLAALRNHSRIMSHDSLVFKFDMHCPQMQHFNLQSGTVENSLRDDMQPADG